MLLTDYPKTIKIGDILFFDEKCTRKAEVENVKLLKVKENASFLVIKFKGIDSKNCAESLKSINIFRSIKNSPSLKENQFWTDDIIGCMVYIKSNIPVGTVVDIEKFAANDNLVVKIENENLNILPVKNNIFYIPVIEDYIHDIDLKDKKIILKRIPEYI